MATENQSRLAWTMEAAAKEILSEVSEVFDDITTDLDRIKKAPCNEASDRVRWINRKVASLAGRCSEKCTRLAGCAALLEDCGEIMGDVITKAKAEWAATHPE